MTHRDCVLIAKVLNKFYNMPETKWATYAIANDLAIALREQNPRFDEYEWWLAVEAFQLG